MPRWRLLLTDPASGPQNMALDEALMPRARTTGEWVLRVYSWSAPTLSLGRHQNARAAYDPETLAEAGIAVVRRPTGGRAVLHDREVTYSVTAPAIDAGALRESYERINRLVVDGLRSLGVAVEIAETARAPKPDLTPCFERPSPGELTAAGRKLAGSAQWREDGALLQHGSILVDGDQAPVSTLLRHPLAPPRAPATLRALIGRAPTVAAVAAALFDAVCRHEDRGATELAVDEALLEAAAVLRSRYEDAAWTWRR
ncbi:MAG: lipoate--protein ligase family protein [Gemmatimonadota bacterium]|nr:lipoate--protein ligase family protein [Gemmatimonadota bacterium]